MLVKQTSIFPLDYTYVHCHPNKDAKYGLNLNTGCQTDC